MCGRGRQPRCPTCHSRRAPRTRRRPAMHAVPHRQWAVGTEWRGREGTVCTPVEDVVHMQSAAQRRAAAVREAAERPDDERRRRSDCVASGGDGHEALWAHHEGRTHHEHTRGEGRTELACACGAVLGSCMRELYASADTLLAPLRCSTPRPKTRVRTREAESRGVAWRSSHTMRRSRIRVAWRSSRMVQ
jgi:hypothetical protein